MVVPASLSTSAIMDLRVGTEVRFNEPYRPSQVHWGEIGVIVDMEERRATFGPEFYVRARFRDFITPWIEVWKFARVS
jgi:hypothetical protein